MRIERTAALRVAALVACVPAIFGMDGGCVYTQQPAEGEHGSFTDPYLIGDWYGVSIGDDGTLQAQEKAHSISQADSGELEIMTFLEGDPWLVHRGRSTRIGSDKYISVRLHECLDCDDGDAEDYSPAACPYLVYRYQTFPPAKLAAGLAGRWGAEADTVAALFASHRGELVFTRSMRPEYLGDAIEDGALAGEEFGEGHVCVTEHAASLVAFLVEHDPESFFDWDIMIRRAAGATEISD